MADDPIFTCPDLYWYGVSWLQYPLDYLQHLSGSAYVSPPVRQEWQEWWTAQNQQLPHGGSPPAHGSAAGVRLGFSHHT
jgi:hypothetical protein